jgi:N-acetylneuraminic acid mutarotase
LEPSHHRSVGITFPLIGADAAPLEGPSVLGGNGGPDRRRGRLPAFGPYETPRRDGLVRVGAGHLHLLDWGHSMLPFLRACLISCALTMTAGSAIAQSWTGWGSLPVPLKGSSLVAVGSDLYWFGGRTTGNVVTDAVLRLDTDTGLWSSVGVMPTPCDGAAVEYIDGRFFLAGGFVPEWTARAMVFDPVESTWDSVAPLPSPNSYTGHCTDGTRLYLFGGGHDGAPYDSAYDYDPATNEWTRLTNMPHARKYPAAVCVGGRIYVIGGHTGTFGVVDATDFVDVYDIQSGAWSTAPSLPRALTAADATVLNGRIYVMGGADGSADYVALDGVYSWRPGDRAWRVEPSMPMPAIGLGVATVGDSALFSVGGEVAGDVLNEVHRLLVREPDIVRVSDVPNDQGGRMSLRWLASNLDHGPTNLIESYWVWREVPADLALAALSTGSTLVSAASRLAGGERVFRTTSEGGAIYYWEYVGSQAARGYPAYSYTVPTLFDSLPGSNLWTRVQVEAEFADGREPLASAPDSGYSVDDLAPPAPGPIAYRAAETGLALSWSPSDAPDVCCYRVYFGTTPEAETSAATLLGVSTDTTYVSQIHGAGYFRVRAVDLHGNEGPATTAFANLLSVDDRPTAGLALFAPAPNPSQGPTRIRYSLARAGIVRLALYDLSGRLCHTLASGSRSPGQHEIGFSLQDARGVRLRAGLYFLRLEAENQVVTRRLVIAR